MTRTLVIGVLVVFLSGGAVYAQDLEALRGGAYYRFADPSDITIEVKVWGAVSNPGFYEVRQGLTLSTLLSLAGGPLTTPRMSNTRSTFTLQLYRPQPDGRYQLLTETVMENQLTALAQDPVIMHGDLLMTEERTRQRFGWRDGLSILTALATVALVVDNVIIN